MKKYMIIVSILLLLFAPAIFAQNSGTGVNFLKMPVGPRPVGLGSAFTGVGDNVYTLYWNPAGIGFLRRWEVSAMFNKYFADMYYSAISGVKQFNWLGSRKTAIGLGVLYHGMPEWDATETGAAQKASASNVLGVVSFGQRLDWLTPHLSVGMNAKLGYSKLIDRDSKIAAVDLGIMFRINVFKNLLTLGAALQNVGFQTAYINEKNPLPLGARAGFSYRLLHCPNHRFLFAADVSKFKYSNLKFGFGAEYWFRNLLGIRGGYLLNNEDLGDFAFGATIGLDAFRSGVQFDYAQRDFGEALGFTREGAISIYTVSPEPFHLTEAYATPQHCHFDSVKLSWEKAVDPDECDLIHYRVLIDKAKENVKNAAEAVASVPKKKSDQALFDLETEQNWLKISQLDPGQYFWTTIAVDRAGHTRRASEIASFSISAGDIEVAQLTYLPSRNLAGDADNYQGQIKIVIQNGGGCECENFRVVLTDSFVCDGSKEIVKEYTISDLLPRRSTEQYYTWKTDRIGIHHFSVTADPKNKVYELNEDNNSAQCEAVTIPRGGIFADRDTIRTSKIVYGYSEFPVVPIVFFDQGDASVDADFYVPSTIYPTPALRIIAERLQEHPDIKIQIAGFYDPVSEAGQDSLAQKRMQSVYEILVNELGVATDQIDLMDNYDVGQRRIDRASDYMVNAENRRVEISLADETNEKYLLAPIPFTQPARLREGVLFTSTITPFLEIIGWQVIVQDEQTKEVVHRGNFQIEPGNHLIHWTETNYWDGKNVREQLVALNHTYSYYMILEDKLGREFSTSPKKLYLACDSLERHEEYIFLNRFDEVAFYHPFDQERLNKLADEICGRITKGEDFKFRILGYACEIGDFQYNLNLAATRANKFREIFIKDLQQAGCNENNFTIEGENGVLLPNLTKVEMTRYYKLQGNPWKFNEPLRFFNPCTYREISFPANIPYKNIINRRVMIVIIHKNPL